MERLLRVRAGAGGQMDRHVGANADAVCRSCDSGGLLIQLSSREGVVGCWSSRGGLPAERCHDMPRGSGIYIGDARRG